MKPKIRGSFKDSKTTRIHKRLIREINKTRIQAQAKADKKYGKGKVKITNVYASSLIAARLRK